MINSKRIVVTGGSGLLGYKLLKMLEKSDYDVYATFNQNPIKKEKCFPLDITNKNAVSHAFKNVSPDVVVHTAAYTNVDDCEKNKDVAFAINVTGTKNLAELAEKIGAKFVYISTDYVFDGKKGQYAEDDSTDPIDYYGTTKLEGEKAVQKVCSDFIIARTSVIYGANKKNFVTWIVDSLEKEEINIVSDQYVSPTLNVDLAEQLIALIERDAEGIFHAAGGERINRYDFAIVIADAFGLDKNSINPVSMEDMDWLALRPKDSSLDVSKISNFKKPYGVKKALNLLKKEIMSV